MVSCPAMKSLYILAVVVVVSALQVCLCTEIPQRVNIFVLARPVKEGNKDEVLTKAEEAEHLRLLLELMGNRNSPAEPVVSGTGLRDHRPADYELFSENSNNKLGSRENSKNGDGIHQEYHVHYHTHNHHNGFVKQAPASSDPRAPHLAGFKDFETLLKKREKSKAFTSESGIRSSYNQMSTPRIRDFPGGSPRISEQLSYMKVSNVEGRDRHTMRASDKAEFFSELPVETVQYPEPKPLVTVKKLKRKVNNMNGWVIQRWL